MKTEIKKQASSTRVQATFRVWTGFGVGRTSYNERWRQLYLGTRSVRRRLVGTQLPRIKRPWMTYSHPPSLMYLVPPQNCQNWQQSTTSLRRLQTKTTERKWNAPTSSEGSSLPFCEGHNAINQRTDFSNWFLSYNYFCFRILFIAVGNISHYQGDKYENKCFLDDEPHNLIKTGLHSTGAYCLHRQGVNQHLSYYNISENEALFVP